MCDHGVMSRRLPILAALVVVAVLAGCSQAQDAATDAASSAVSQARESAATEVKRRICAPVQDGQISAQDKQVLSGLLPAARSAGVPAQIMTPLEQIASAGDQAPTESVAALRKACG